MADARHSEYGTDDRGRPLVEEPVETKTGWRRWLNGGVVNALLGAGLMLAYLSYLWKTGRIAWPLLFIPLWPLPVWAVLWRRAARRPDGSRAQLHADLAWRIAHGTCPNCEYGLADIPAAEDGCIVCPECGTAWHRERMTLVGSDPRARDPLRKRPDHELGALTLTDDRSVELLRPLKWPMEWACEARATCRCGYDLTRVPIDGGIVRCPECGTEQDEGPIREFERTRIDAIERALYLSDRKRRAFMLFTAFAPPVILAVVVVCIVERADWFAGLVCGLVVGAVVSAFGLWSIRRGRPVKQAILAQKLCPNCGGALSGAPGFDGCTACAACGRAWKL